MTPSARRYLLGDGEEDSEFAVELRGVLMKAIAHGADHEALTTALVAQIYGSGAYHFAKTPTAATETINRAVERCLRNLPKDISPS